MRFDAGLDDDTNGQAVLPRKVEVALIVRRHGHDGAGAVLRQHEVGDPDWHFFAGERVAGLAARVEPLFPGQPRVAIEGTEPAELAAKRRRGRALRRKPLDERMLGSQQDERRPVDRVDAGREDLDGVAADDRKRDARAFGAPDPVALHDDDFLRPVGQRLEALQQIVGVRRDAEEPLLEIARYDRRGAPPARALDHLLIGEDRLTARTPVDGRVLPVRETALEHLQEDPLVELVVLGQTGGDFALPGVADAQPLQLPFHVRDVPERRGLGRGPGLDGCIFSGQAERVPAERMQHVEAAQPLRARHHIADDVVAHVSDVRVPGGVREHLQAVVLRPRRILSDLKGARGGPLLLPFLVELLRLVIRHGAEIILPVRRNFPPALTAKVRDRDIYLVVGFPDGDLPEQLFFDTQTGLLVRKGTATATALGDYAVQTDYDDYRDVAGVKIPYLVRTIGISPADGVTTCIEKVDANPQLDAGMFIKPVSK